MSPEERALIEAQAQQAVADGCGKLTFTTLTPIDKPERDHCPRCQLPSVLGWWMSIEAGGRLLDDSLIRLSLCTECGEEQWGH